MDYKRYSKVNRIQRQTLSTLAIGELIGDMQLFGFSNASFENVFVSSQVSFESRVWYMSWDLFEILYLTNDMFTILIYLVHTYSIMLSKVKLFRLFIIIAVFRKALRRTAECTTRIGRILVYLQ